MWNKDMYKAFQQLYHGLLVVGRVELALQEQQMTDLLSSAFPEQSSKCFWTVPQPTLNTFQKPSFMACKYLSCLLGMFLFTSFSHSLLNNHDIRPTVLCKILGVYQIGYHNRETGKRSNEYVAVMQVSHAIALFVQ